MLKGQAKQYQDFASSGIGRAVCAVYDFCANAQWAITSAAKRVDAANADRDYAQEADALISSLGLRGKLSSSQRTEVEAAVRDEAARTNEAIKTVSRKHGPSTIAQMISKAAQHNFETMTRLRSEVQAQ